MRNRSTSLALAYAGLATIDTALAGAGDRARRWRRLTKPLLMPTLAAAFVNRTRRNGSKLRLSTAAAQAFSWAGDVALLGGSRRAFLSGVGSFFGAHVAYVGGFLTVRDESGFDSRGMRAAAGAWIVLAPTMAVLAGRKDPRLRAPVAAYATILSAMVGSSTLLDRDLSPSSRRKIGAGTALFLVSDGILGVREFALHGRVPMLDSAVMATYTAGQWLIADGVADICRQIGAPIPEPQ